MDSSRDNLPTIIKTYLDSTVNNTYVLGKYDIPVPSNHILITSYNGLLTHSNNITISSINISSINGISVSALIEHHSNLELSNTIGIPPGGTQGQVLMKKNNNDYQTEWHNTSDIFESNLTVQLPPGRSFGKYLSGEIIPAAGKTAKEIILDAIKDILYPAPSLTFNPPIIPFNSSNADITITIPNNINNILNQTLKFKDDNNKVLDIQNQVARHTINSLILNKFRTDPITYEYNITDTSGLSDSITYTLPIASYIPPILSLIIDTNDRVIGNIDTQISGIIIKNSVNVPIISAKIEYMYNNNNNYIEIWKKDDFLDSQNEYTMTYIHNPSELINNTYPNSITYRLQVIDEYTISLSQTYTINFYPYIYYGSFPNISNILKSYTTSDGQIMTDMTINSDGSNININTITSLPYLFNKDISNLIINTGNVNKVFVIALPNTNTINSVIDKSAYNANIISCFKQYNHSIIINNIEVNYNIYIYTIGVSYSFNHILDVSIN